MNRRHVAAVLAAVLLLPLAACSDDDEQRAKHPEEIERPAELTPAWSAQVDTPFRNQGFTFRPQGQLTTWRVGENVIVLGETGAAAFNRSTGEQRWTFRVPKRLGTVCGTSAAPNRNGVAPLVFSKNDECTGSVGAIDLNSGRLQWHRSLGHPEYSPLDIVPSVTDTTLTLPLFCEDVRRYELSTGKVLPNLLPAREGCFDHVAVGDGIMVATRQDPQTRAETIEAYDEETARLKWTRRLDEPTDVQGVISARPLVLDLEVSGGHRLFRRYGAKGHPGAYVGYESGSNFPMQYGVIGEQMVIAYGSSSGKTLHGFDLTSGEEVWGTDPGLTTTVGRDGDELVTLSQVTTQDGSGLEFWVGHIDPDEPERHIAYGRIQVPTSSMPAFSWVDGQLFVDDGRSVTAYNLPADAKDPMPPTPTHVKEPEWADGDITPEQIADACLAIQDSTLRELGFRLDLPRPAGCHWYEGKRPDHVDKTLSVETFAIVPGDEGGTAVESAIGQVKEWRDEKATNHVAAMKAVDGLGDEAWQATKVSRQAVTTRLIARHHNLVVIVHHTVDSGVPGVRIPAPAAVRRDVQQVFRDLLAAPKLAAHG